MNLYAVNVCGWAGKLVIDNVHETPNSNWTSATSETRIIDINQTTEEGVFTTRTVATHTHTHTVTAVQPRLLPGIIRVATSLPRINGNLPTKRHGGTEEANNYEYLHIKQQRQWVHDDAVGKGSSAWTGGEGRMAGCTDSPGIGTKTVRQ